MLAKEGSMMGSFRLLHVAIAVAAALAGVAAESACTVVEPPTGVPGNGTLRHTSAAVGGAAEEVCWELRCSGQLTLVWLRFSAPRPVSLYAGGVVQWKLSGRALLPQPATYDDAVTVRVPAAAAAAAAEELVLDWACEAAPPPDCAETHRPAAPDNGEADAVVGYARENVTTTGAVCWLLRCAAAAAPASSSAAAVVSVRWTRFETESGVSLYTVDAEADAEADAAATRRWTRRGQELPPSGEYAGDAGGPAPAVLVRMEGTGGSAVDREDVEFAWACGGPSSPEPPAVPVPTGVPIPPVDSDRAALRVVVYDGAGCRGVAVASALLPAGLEDGVCAGATLADGRRVRVAAAGCAGGVRRVVACTEEGRRVWVETGAAGAAAGCALLLGGGGGGGSAALSGACPADTAVLRIVLRSPWRVVRREEFHAALRGAVAAAMGGVAMGVTPARVGILGERGTATRLHVWLRAQGVRDAERATANLEASLASPDSYIQRLFGSTGVIAARTEDAAALARTYGEEGTVPVVTVEVETRESVATWSIVLVVLLGLGLLCMVGGAAWVAVFAEDEDDEAEEEYEEREETEEDEGAGGAEAASAAGYDDEAAAKAPVEENAAVAEDSGGGGGVAAEAGGVLAGRSPLDAVSNALQIIQRSGRPTQPSLKYVESKSVEI